MRTILIAVCLMVVGCGPDYGPILTEQARVKALIYVPEGHGGGVSPGITTGGEFTFTVNNISIPARYGVVFECQHGTFAVSLQRDVWERLREGSDVTVEYREVLEDGHVVDLDFVGVR